MSDNGSGTFLVDSTGQPVQLDTIASDEDFNELTADLADGLSNRICKDGQTTTTAVIPFAQGISTASITNDDGLAHGVYTPTITNGTNVASSAVYGPFIYIRLGNNVYVSGIITMTATAAGGTATDLELTLPINSELAHDYDLAGNFSDPNGTSGTCKGNATTNRCLMNYLAQTTGLNGLFINFMYRVL